MSPDSLYLMAVSAGALGLSALASRWLCDRAGSRLGALDVPNARSLHVAPVPRTGGLGVLLGIAIPLLVLALLGQTSPVLGWLAVAVTLVAGVAFIDDLGEVSRSARLFAQLVAALVLLLAGGLRWTLLDLPGLTLVLPFSPSLVLSVFVIVWMINLYNFMDGMDGFAAGMALFGFSALAVLGWSGGEPLFALCAATIAAAGAGFLSVNFPPARIFLGDVGSSSLGLLAAGLALWGSKLGLFPLWVAGLAFSPFIVDATWTLIARLLRGERVWEAHRSHHYQRLVLAGWSHRRTVLHSYLVMAGAAVCAIAAPGLSSNDQWLLLGAWAVIYLLIHLKVRLVERQGARSSA